MATSKAMQSIHAIRTIERITGVLLKRGSTGITQMQLAKEVGVSAPTIHRYMEYLKEDQRAHVAGKIDSPNGGKSVIYKPGPAPNEPIRPKVKRDPFSLPGSFFGVKHGSK